MMNQDAAVADFNRAAEIKPKLLGELLDRLKTYDQNSIPKQLPAVRFALGKRRD